MIAVKLNQPEFEYDIHSLIKAFFPEENVSVTAEEKRYDEEISGYMEIDYKQDSIHMEWKQEKEGESLQADDISVDFSDRKETKNQLKQGLYQLLSALTGKKLPWGTLTGIRPTKIPKKQRRH